MYVKTRGVVLHTLKFSETSVISRIYTEELGLVSYIVKGVRSAKSQQKAILLQPLSILDLEVNHRENKQLQFIKEFSRAFNYQSIPFETLKSAIAVFMLEVISKSIREHEPNHEMFQFIIRALINLDLSEKLNPDFHLSFLVHFSSYLGFMPHGNYSASHPNFALGEGVFVSSQSECECLNPRESELIHKLISGPPFNPIGYPITRLERKRMLNNLSKYYALHLDNFVLKSPEILEELLD